MKIGEPLLYLQILKAAVSLPSPNATGLPERGELGRALPGALKGQWEPGEPKMVI